MGEGEELCLTCRLSADLRKLLSASWETCTSPLYMNSSKAAMLSGVVASSMMTHWPFVGVFSNRSANFFEQAASISLCALKTAPVGEIERENVSIIYLNKYIQFNNYMKLNVI